MELDGAQRHGNDLFEPAERSQILSVSVWAATRTLLALMRNFWLNSVAQEIVVARAPMTVPKFE